MSQFAEAVMTQTFLQYALAGGLLASLACGIIGPYVVVMRLGLLAGGIAHALLGGLGIAYFFGQSPLAGALVMAVVAALLIARLRVRLSPSNTKFTLRFPMSSSKTMFTPLFA